MYGSCSQDVDARLTLIMPSFGSQEKGGSAMDQPLFVGAIAFCGGWIARDFIWTTPKSEPQICNCNCKCVGDPNQSTWTTSYSLILFLLAVGFCIAFSQTALALRVSFKDDSTGADRTFSVDVKGAGKSKGIFGSAKGLQLVG